MNLWQVVIACTVSVRVILTVVDSAQVDLGEVWQIVGWGIG